ncbi:MAG: endonuclease Q family protein, partial [Candidatus Diapherotrites archaeon]|nr:endonuclease Q family protein [Candidatus Diapherotrites archaeon]
MKEFDCDLHFHSYYAGGVSKNMTMAVFAQQVPMKGLQVLVTADITHKDWFQQMKSNLVEEENGVYKHKTADLNFIVGTEVCCNKRVHHLIYFPSLESALELKEKFKGHAIMDSYGTGRPLIRKEPEWIAEQVEKVGGMIGPAHAFTPHFGLYGHFKNLKEVYGGMTDKVKFLELGLSADTYLADLIEENHKLVFLSNSDSHGPWPHRIGREFNRIKMQKPSFKELQKALEMKGGREITLNVGLDPREGKYHCSACASCFTKYSHKDSMKLSWRCAKPDCKGLIAKGVRDRILELANFKEETHPEFRPEYMHSMPLAEIIQVTYNLKSPTSKKVQQTWTEFIHAFKSEINVLIDAPVNELEKVNAEVAKKIEAFRKGYVLYVPGGGGN